MSNLKLVVGGAYVTRDGRVVQIVRTVWGRYLSNDPDPDTWWYPDGRYLGVYDHDSDLIAEAPALIAPAVGVTDADVEAACAVFLTHNDFRDAMRAALEQFLSARSTK